MSQYFRQLIDQAREQLCEVEALPDANPRLLNEARMAIFQAEQMLTQHPDCAKDKTLHFAFKAHLGRARKAVTMIWAEPRLRRDDKRQGGTAKGRKKQWLELRKWIEKRPKLTAPQLWKLLDKSSSLDFEKDEDRIFDRRGRSIGESRFAGIVSEVRNPKNSESN